MNYKGMDYYKFNRVNSMLNKLFIKKGSINKMLMNHMSQDVIDFCAKETIDGGYQNLSEYFADQITEIYFKEKNQ